MTGCPACRKVWGGEAIPLREESNRQFCPLTLEKTVREGRDGREEGNWEGGRADPSSSILTEFQHCRALSLSFSVCVCASSAADSREEDKCETNPLTEKTISSLCSAPSTESAVLVSRLLSACHSLWEYIFVAVCVCVIYFCNKKEQSRQDAFLTVCFCKQAIYVCCSPVAVHAHDAV